MTDPHLHHLRAAGVSVVLSTADARLPRVLHWGDDLGELTDADLAALDVAATEPAVNGELDARYGVSVIPEHSWGWMHTPGIAGHRAGQHFSTRFAVERARPSVRPDGAQRLDVIAVDAAAQLELSLGIELQPDGLLRARAVIESTAPAEAAPFTLDALQLFMPVPRHAAELLDFAGRWVRERTPQRCEFTLGTHLRESRRGKPGHDAAFLMATGQPGFGFRSGEVWATHVGWSGNHRFIAERTNGGIGLIGGGELLLPGEVTLGHRESYRSPWVYWTHGHGLDAASARVHRFLRSRDTHPPQPRPVLVNTWEAVYFDHDHDQLRALADAAAAVGAERFVLDDGWFRHRRADNAGLGDWYVDEGVYPDGLRWLADYVRERGLEFGLWVEPEMVNPDSDLARAHPEWIAQPLAGGGRLPLEARRQQVLDLTHPDAYAHIEQRLHALVAELEPAYLKWDHNRDLLEAGSAVTGRPIAHAQTLAFYALLAGLKRRFPGLEIESCAGGGGRVDLGVLEHADRVWASDSNDAIERQSINRHTGLLVPPEMMGSHIGPPEAKTSGRTQGLDFRAATALWGHLGVEWNVAGEQASAPATRERLRAWIELHRQWRPLLHSGDVVRADLGAAGRLLHGVVARDRTLALFGLAATDSVVENPTGPLRLPGLDPQRRYRVTNVGPLELWPGAMRAMPAWWTNPAERTGDDGIVLPGSVLAAAGIQAPALNPEEYALIGATAVD